MGALSIPKVTSFVGFKSPPSPVIVNAAVVSTAFAPKLAKMYSPNAKVANMLQIALVITGIALTGLYSTSSIGVTSPYKSASEPVASSQEPLNWRAPLADYTPPVMDILAQDKVYFDPPLSPFLCAMGSEDLEVSFEHSKDEVHVEMYDTPSVAEPGIQVASLPSGSSSARAAPVASSSPSATASRRRSDRLRGNDPPRRPNNDEDNGNHGRGPGRGTPAEHSNSKGGSGKGINHKPGPFDGAPPPPPPPPGPPSSCTTQDDNNDKKASLTSEQVDWFMLATFVLAVACARFRKVSKPVPVTEPLPLYRGIPDHSTAREGDAQYCVATPELKDRALTYRHPMTPPRSMAEIYIPLDEGPTFGPSVFAEGALVAHSDVQPFRRIIGREVVPCPQGFVEVRFEEFSSSRVAWGEEILNTMPYQTKGSRSIYDLNWRTFFLANAQTLWEISQFFFVHGGMTSIIPFLVMVSQILFPINNHNVPENTSGDCFDDQPKATSQTHIHEQPAEPASSLPLLAANASSEIVANHEVLEQSLSSFHLELLNPLAFDSFADFGTPAASSTEADIAKMLLLSEPSFAGDVTAPSSPSSVVDKGKAVQLDLNLEQGVSYDASHVSDEVDLPEIAKPVSKSSSVTSVVLNTTLNPKAAPFIPRSPRPCVASTSTLPSPPCSPSTSAAPTNPENPDKLYRRRRKHKSQINRERREREVAEAEAAAEAGAQV